MIHVQIDPQFEGQFSSKVLVKAAQVALSHQKLSLNNQITIMIGDDDTLHQLNKDFLGVDGPTDVLSFSLDENDPESGETYLGDIAISYPKAVSQAKTSGHPTIEEIQLLVVHGCLHLAGHDHAEPAEKTEMWAAQDQILTALGVSARPPVE